jgi:hypothetical protein
LKADILALIQCHPVHGFETFYDPEGWLEKSFYDIWSKTTDNIPNSSAFITLQKKLPFLFVNGTGKWE